MLVAIPALGGRKGDPWSELFKQEEQVSEHQTTGDTCFRVQGEQQSQKTMLNCGLP